MRLSDSQLKLVIVFLVVLLKLHLNFPVLSSVEQYQQLVLMPTTLSLPELGLGKSSFVGVHFTTTLTECSHRFFRCLYTNVASKVSLLVPGVPNSFQ